jgi:CheY-like chemotaxis protein
MTPVARTSRPSVLVVDDDPLVRMHVVDIVEDAGFDAIAARNADEAIGILEERSDVTLLFTDVHMPGSMDGLRLAHAVRDRWPPIKIIVVSGRMTVTQNKLPTNSRFFSKPFHSERMIEELKAFVKS